ncbi:MAG: BON domain-containing protein, partial [Bryobacteraceae bacterium]
MNPTDRALTRKVRRALMADKSLSTYAHNVKIISQEGMVTLKGPVRSEAEKAAVEAKATEAVGADAKVT